MRNNRNILVIVFLLFSVHVSGQYANPRKLQAFIKDAIEKAYPASVRIWAFDTLSNTRTGAQFTGVVVKADGHILTAAHVNTPGNTYKIMFPNGQSSIAVGLGEIELAEVPFTPDVAMMKIVGKGLWPYAEMGWSSALSINEPCISIAYPESLDQPLPMVRFGHIQDLNNKYGFIQSTCIMEPGDSGGPLFDCLGRVIGIHSAVDIKETDNFEVPVDLYRKYWTALNKPETYTSFPLLKDDLGKDLLATRIIAIAGLNDLNSRFEVPDKLKGSSVQIESNIHGEAQKAQGTLFSLLDSKLKSGAEKSSAKKSSTDSNETATSIPLTNSDENDRGSFITFKKQIFTDENTSILISKSSLVGDSVIAKIAGKYISLKVVARDQENDLVLLQPSVKVKGGIDLEKVLSDTIGFNQLGNFLLSPLANDSCKVSILGSTQFGLPKISSIGYLPAQISFFRPLLVTSVPQQTATAICNLEKGDLILSINGVPLIQRADYIRECKKYWVGDEVNVQIKRGDSILSKQVMLEPKLSAVSSHPALLFEGGKSIRHDGFKRVFVHDAKLKPQECGGPVFDNEGHFYGINIARFSRVSNIVIPAAVVLRFICQAH